MTIKQTNGKQEKKKANLLDFLTLLKKERKRKGRSANSLNHIKLMPGFLKMSPLSLEVLTVVSYFIGTSCLLLTAFIRGVCQLGLLVEIDKHFQIHVTCAETSPPSLACWGDAQFCSQTLPCRDEPPVAPGFVGITLPK